MIKKIYYIVNIVTFLITLFFLIFNNYFNSSAIKLNNIFLLIIIYIFIHFFKSIKQYLMLIESDVHFKDFISLYVRSTFCSIILPYKLGEIFKGYIYGYKINNYFKGFLIIIVDKFFDAIVLLSILFLHTIKNNNVINNIMWLLLVFTILLIIIFISFKSTYYYLNKHFVLYKNSKNSIFVLTLLEKFNELFIYVNGIIKNRVLILLILTVLSWSFEYLFVYILDISDFLTYTNSFFFGTKSSVVSNYIIISTLIFVVFELMFFIRKCCVKK